MIFFLLTLTVPSPGGPNRKLWPHRYTGLYSPSLFFITLPTVPFASIHVAVLRLRLILFIHVGMWCCFSPSQVVHTHTSLFRGFLLSVAGEVVNTFNFSRWGLQIEIHLNSAQRVSCIFHSMYLLTAVFPVLCRHRKPKGVPLSRYSPLFYAVSILALCRHKKTSESGALRRWYIWLYSIFCILKGKQTFFLHDLHHLTPE